jgi:hypothetical protein
LHDISQKFKRQFIPTLKSDPLTRKVLRKLHKAHSIDHSFTPFTVAMTNESILRSSNSTTTGPDGLTSLHLKHLGHAGLSYLTELFNLSVSDAIVPTIWKTALILPVPKPGNLAEQGNSYRPISLLSPVIKILELLLLPSLTTSFHASSTQHGFRMDRSTTMASLPLCNMVSEGFNAKKPASRSAFVAIDISVDLNLLIDEISASQLHHNYVRWLSAYVVGRQPASTRGASPDS